MTSDEALQTASAAPASDERANSGGKGLFARIVSNFIGVATEPLRPVTREDIVEQDHINFVQNINEVQMLLDHISGNPTKNLGLVNNRVADPADATKTLKDSEVVRKISEISLKYSESLAPGKPSGEINPNDAAFLILVKDALNSIAYPATGSTIAFTTLFTQDANSSRTLAAAIAYPSLIALAESFKWTKHFLTRAALILAIIAAFLLWQVAYGVQLAAHFDEAKKNDSAYAAQVYTQVELEHPADAEHHQSSIGVANVNDVCGLKYGPVTQKAEGSAAPTDAAPQRPSQSRSIALERLCSEYAYQHALLCVAVADLGKYGESALFYFYRLFLPMHDLWPADVCGDGKRAWANGHQEDAKSIAAVLAAMSNYFVPLLFGAVGALVSLVRSLSDKVANNLLSPRDLALWLIRLPISVVAGVCVGLFLTPSSVQGAGNGSIGSFAISASGVAFLAGYGAESFFGALDTVIGRLFGVSSTARPERQLGGTAVGSQG